ncbi:hypothetical protein P3S67_016083 [Capsicum chacoense]
MSGTPSLVAGSPDTPGFIDSPGHISCWRKTYWASDEFKNKYCIATQNRCSETSGLGTGPSKHTGGSRSTATEMGRKPNSWEIFNKLHLKKDGSFVDAKSKRINEVC